MTINHYRLYLTYITICFYKAERDGLIQYWSASPISKSEFRICIFPLILEI